MAIAAGPLDGPVVVRPGRVCERPSWGGTIQRNPSPLGSDCKCPERPNQKSYRAWVSTDSLAAITVSLGALGVSVYSGGRRSEFRWERKTTPRPVTLDVAIDCDAATNISRVRGPLQLDVTVERSTNPKDYDAAARKDARKAGTGSTAYQVAVDVGRFYKAD